MLSSVLRPLNPVTEFSRRMAGATQDRRLPSQLQSIANASWPVLAGGRRLSWPTQQDEPIPVLSGLDEDDWCDAITRQMAVDSSSMQQSCISRVSSPSVWSPMLMLPSSEMLPRYSHSTSLKCTPRDVLSVSPRSASNSSSEAARRFSADEAEATSPALPLSFISQQ